MTKIILTLTNNNFILKYTNYDGENNQTSEISKSLPSIKSTVPVQLFSNLFLFEEPAVTN